MRVNKAHSEFVVVLSHKRCKLGENCVAMGGKTPVCFLDGGKLVIDVSNIVIEHGYICRGMPVGPVRDRGQIAQWSRRYLYVTVDSYR